MTPAVISHTELRDYLRRQVGASLEGVAEELRSRGFQCDSSKVEWAAGRTNFGCSRYNFSRQEAAVGTLPAGYKPPLNYLNVELAASGTDDTLLSYRTYESGKAVYGKQ